MYILHKTVKFLTTLTLFGGEIKRKSPLPVMRKNDTEKRNFQILRLYFNYMIEGILACLDMLARAYDAAYRAVKHLGE